MKKVTCAVFIFTMMIFLVNPLSSPASNGHSISGHSISGHGSGSYGRGGYWGGGYGRGGYWGDGYWGWWEPWAVIGGAAVLASYYDDPYYDSYYNSSYYAPSLVVIREQPSVYGQPVPSVLPTVGRIFVYPRKGQSEELQAKDRYECHSWGVSQTGYDPTQPTSSMPRAQLNQMRADYNRAMGACLDGRGYTMR